MVPDHPFAAFDSDGVLSIKAVPLTGFLSLEASDTPIQETHSRSTKQKHRD
jgi:hypothetical protein